MKIQEDCFFYIDSLSSDTEKHLLVRCVGCQKNKEDGWFWNGSSRGYSKYSINCNDCGKLIYKYEEENKQVKEEIAEK